MILQTKQKLNLSSSRIS